MSPEDHVMAREAIEKLRKRQGQLAPRRPLGHGKPEVIDHGEARAVLSTSAATHVQPYAPRDIMSKALVTGRRFAPDRGVGGHGSTSQPTDTDRAKGFNSSASLPCSVEASPYLQPVQEPDQTLGTDPRQNPYHLQRGGCGSKHGREPSLDHLLPATLAFHTSAVKRALVLTEPMGDANKQEQVPRDLLINAESPAEHTRRANPPLQPPPGMIRSRGNGRLHTLRNIGNDDPSDHLQAIIIEHGDIRLMPFSQESLEQNLRQTLETQRQSLWEQFLHVDAGTQGLLVKGTDWARTATNRDATLVAFHRLQRPSGPDAMVALLLLKESLEPMQLVDEAGRTFTVPYGAYHSYEVSPRQPYRPASTKHIGPSWQKFHATMLNLLGDDEVLIAAVREGAFQLQNEKGETIHPTLWASCIRPGAAVAIAKTRRRFLVKSDASKRSSSPQAEALSTGEPRPVTPAWKAALLKRTNGGRRTSPLDQTASQADGILPTPISTFAGSPPRPRVRRRRRILSRLRSSVGALRSELLNMKVWTSSRSSESSGSSGSSGSCRVSEPGMMWVRRKRTRPSARFHHACISGSQNLAPPARRRHSSALRTPLAHRLPLSGLSVRPDRVFDTTGKTYGYDSECINSSARYANRFEGLDDEEQLLSSSDDESEDVSLGEEADVGSWSLDELLSRWTNARGNPPLEEGVAKEIVH